MKGYYNKKEGEKEIKPIFSGKYMVEEFDAIFLPVGTVFTARNGRWYIKVDLWHFRPWHWA